MVCLKNICINTLHKGDNDDNNNNNNIFKTNRYFTLEVDSNIRDGNVCPISSLVLRDVNNLMDMKTIAADDDQTSRESSREGGEK